MNKRRKVLLVGSVIILIIVAVIIINKKINHKNSNSFDLPKEVYEYAEKNYAKEPKKRAAFLQNAKSLNAIAYSLYSREILIKMDEKATSCLSDLFEGASSWEAINVLEALVFNTPEKIRTYIKWNKSFSGKMLGDTNYTVEEACDE